jgi:hypothetical protein
MLERQNRPVYLRSTEVLAVYFLRASFGSAVRSCGRLPCLTRRCDMAVRQGGESWALLRRLPAS